MKVKGDKAFRRICMVILSVFSIISIVPFILLIMSSVSSETSLIQYGYNFIPKQFSLEAYEYLWMDAKEIFKAYGTTVIITAGGTAISLLITLMAAYPLSKNDFKHRNVILFILFFTTLFNGGLVPSYVMWTKIFHIKNTYFAYLLPGMLCSAMGIILIKNYFKFNVPEALMDAAKLDGAGEWNILFKIIVPISKPILAVTGINTGLAFWNDWQNGLYYIDDTAKYNIQVLLNRILNDMQYMKTMYQQGNASIGQVASITDSMPTTAARMAIAVIVILPILLVFPFVQKYFVKGIVVGAVKG